MILLFSKLKILRKQTNSKQKLKTLRKTTTLTTLAHGRTFTKITNHYGTSKSKNSIKLNARQLTGYPLSG